MSFFEGEFEEIDLNDSECKSAGLKKYQRKPLKKKNIPVLNKYTADPNTFEYETLLRQINIHQKHFLDSNFIKTPSPRSDTRKTVERLIFNHQLSENRKQFLRKEKEIDELKLCTFSPQLTRTLKKSNSERQSNNLLQVAPNKKLKKCINLRESAFFSKNVKGFDSSSLKSHSQEHADPCPNLFTPCKGKAQEGRPPIPRCKINKKK